MKRRDFIAGGVAATAVGHARAQQNAKVHRIAVAHPSTPVNDISEQGTYFYRAFFQKLRELGYGEPQNLSVARYSGEGQEDRFAEMAREVVRNGPDVIVAAGDRLTRDIRAATDAIPIVTVVADPVALGIAASLAHPGQNMTGVTGTGGLEIWGKRLELIREMVPSASRVAYLASRRVWEAPETGTLKDVAREMNIVILGPPLESPIRHAEYRRVFAAMAQERANALVVGDHPENSTNRGLIVALAAEFRLPAIHLYPEIAQIGGLIAYGPDYADLSRHMADQVGQILNGAKPGDIPFMQPTKFTLAINLKTAKALGITVPPTLVIAADEVVE
ncbi:MAG TPA: ABC transporter substrate-binding protein [Stellaceae bacterium]|nr:ABC transporter substrate-binding protein [Stellaceae bacterium]